MQRLRGGGGRRAGRRAKPRGLEQTPDASKAGDDDVQESGVCVAGGDGRKAACGKNGIVKVGKVIDGLLNRFLADGGDALNLPRVNRHRNQSLGTGAIGHEVGELGQGRKRVLSEEAGQSTRRSIQLLPRPRRRGLVHLLRLWRRGLLPWARLWHMGDGRDGWPVEDTPREQPDHRSRHCACDGLHTA